MCLCYVCVVGVGLCFSAMRCGLWDSSVEGLPEGLWAGCSGVCFAVVWWVKHSPLIYYVLLLVFYFILGVFYLRSA